MGLIHESLGVLCLGLGAWVLARPKGTTTHVWTGRLYVAAMLLLNLTALSLYHLTGTFNIFHVLALFSLAMLLVGFLSVRLRRRMARWLWRHYQYMAWSYVGLLAATVNEAWVRIPALKQLGASRGPMLEIAATMLVVLVSAAVIRANQAKTLALFSTPAAPPSVRST